MRQFLIHSIATAILFMLPLIIMIIESDPLANGRAMEALRVAAGLCVWQKLNIVLCLKGKGLLLFDWADLAFEESEHCPEYFKILAEHSVTICTIRQENEAHFLPLKTPAKTLSPVEWSPLLEQARCILSF
jgi:hypothetical protein